jgi:hypothetical protein
MKKNVAGQIVGAQINAKADGTPVTTGTTEVYVTGDGGTQAIGSSGSPACTHEGNGFWTYAPAQAETNYDHVAFTFVHADGINATVQVYPTFPQTGDSFARIGAPVGASISADVAAVPTTVWAYVVEGSRTATQMMRGFAAALLAKASGMATTTAVFRDIDDSKNRITATVDANGNRSAVTLDLT